MEIAKCRCLLLYIICSQVIYVCVCVWKTPSIPACLPAAHIWTRSREAQRFNVDDDDDNDERKKNPFSGPVNTMWVNARAVGGDHDRLRLREKCQLFAAAAVTNERTKEEEEEERWEARNHVSKYVHTHAIPKRKKEKKKEKTQKSSD